LNPFSTDATWKTIEAELHKEKEACLTKLANPETSWEQTLEYRGRYALVIKLLKLPEALNRAAVTTTLRK
jgi:hypothetical protein